MHLAIENNRLEEMVVDQNKTPDARKGVGAEYGPDTNQ
jgi:hypothetical protein